MKKFYKILLIVIVIATVIIGFSVRNFANAKTYDTKILSSELSDALQNWIISSYSRYYKNIGVSITPEGKVAIKNGVASEVFNTKINLTLKAESVEDLPFIKGMLNYFNSKKATATKAQIEAAEKLINDWNLELKDYIDKPEPTANATFKIVAKVTKNGIEKSTVRLYIEEPSESGPGDAFYPVPSSIFASPEKMEKAGAEQMKETLQKALNSQIKTKSSFPYNRIAARDYANRWTSNPPLTEQYCCHHKESNGKCDVWQDASKWNNEEYPYYSGSYCNDCADYVSQSLHAGGILIDPGHWERLKDGNDPNYPWAWTYVPSLRNYMRDHGYWTPSNFTYANAGNVIVIPNYHTMIIVLNDTIHRQFSAHTRDRKQHPYYSSNGWEYYKVQKP